MGDATPVPGESQPVALAVGLVVRDDGAVLIAKKSVVAGHFLSGAWHVPGGRVEAGESLEQAVKRELREEAGIDVDVVARLGVVDLAAEGGRGLVTWFRCAPRNHALAAGDDVTQVEYVSPAEAVARFPPASGRYFPDGVKAFFGLVGAAPLTSPGPSRG
jgi:8-oxo-dGTP diphosphatase